MCADLKLQAQTEEESAAAQTAAADPHPFSPDALNRRSLPFSRGGGVMSDNVFTERSEVYVSYF